MPTPITVTATLNDPSSTALQGNAFVRFRLRNFQGFVPQVSGTSILAEIQVDSLPNSSGLISQTLWANNQITPGTTFYTVEFYNNGRIVSSGNYLFNASTNLNTASQLNTPPVPPGFSLVLENNGTLNSSQSTLNLVSGSGVTITDLGSGNIQIAAASVAGRNIIVTPAAPATTGATPNLSPMPSGQATWASFSPGGSTHSVCFYVPASSILTPCSSWNCSIYQGSATSSLSIKMCIYQCSPGSTQVVATANVTFGGQTAPSWTSQAQTIHTSDTIGLPVSPAYDYYFVCDCLTNTPYIGEPGTAAVGATGLITITNTDNYGLSVGDTISFSSVFANEPYSLLVNWIAQS